MAPSYSELKKVLDKYAIGHDVTEGIIASKKNTRKEILIQDILRGANESFEVSPSLIKILNRMLKEELAKLWHLRNVVLPKILNPKVRTSGNNEIDTVNSQPTEHAAPSKDPVPSKPPEHKVSFNDPAAPHNLAISSGNPEETVPSKDLNSKVPAKDAVSCSDPNLKGTFDDKMLEACVLHIRNSMHMESIPSNALQVIPLLVQMDEQALNVVGKSVNFIRGKLKDNDVEKVPVVAVDWDKLIDSNFHRVELHSASPDDLYNNLQVKCCNVS